MGLILVQPGLDPPARAAPEARGAGTAPGLNKQQLRAGCNAVSVGGVSLITEDITDP